MKNIGVLFDYNGVLVDDEHLQHQAMAEVAEKYAIELSDRIYNDLCLGRTDAEGFENVQNAFPQLADVSIGQLIAQKVTRYQKIVQEGSIMYPEIRDLIEKMHQECKLGVVTGALSLEVEPVLDRAELTQFFACVITANDISRGKPNPEGYLKGIGALGLEPASVVVIEDTPTGIRAAKAAELACIAVEHTVHRDRLGEADMVIERVTDVTAGSIQELLGRSE